MDPLTHTLTGAALSRAGFNRWCPRSAAILMLAANAPDIDVISAFGGSLTYLDYHRHITHALVLVPLLAILSAGVVAAFRPARLNLKRNWWRMILTALAGVLSHLALDWTNIYGIRLFLPFSGEWFQGGFTNVVDLWIWLILAAAFAGPFLSRLISGEIGAKRTSGRGAAVTALVLLCGYDFGRYLLHNRAVGMVESRLYEGEPPLRTFVVPGPLNPLRWTCVIETSGFFTIENLNALADFDPGAGRILPKPALQPALEAARGTRTMQRYLSFAQAPYWRIIPVDEPEHAMRVEVIDLRFGQPAQPRFIASVLIDSTGKPIREGFGFGPTVLH